MKEKLADSVYAQIRQAIIIGELSSDELLQEQGVADQYGVSKITAREVLQRLCHDHYLKSLPRKGYLLLEISHVQLNMIQKVRYQVEVLALREIIRHCTDAEIDQLEAILETPASSQYDPYATVNSNFHLQLARMSKNPYLYDTLHTFIGSVCRYAMTNGASLITQVDEPHHHQIVDALRKRDMALAAEELRLDLQLSRDEI